MQSKLIDLRI